MNIRALRLPILFTGFILSVLVSLSAFSMRSEASTSSVPFLYSTRTASNGDYSRYLMTCTLSDDYFCFTSPSFYNNYNQNNRYCGIITRSSSSFSTSRIEYDPFGGIASTQNNNWGVSNARTYVKDGLTYYIYIVETINSTYNSTSHYYNFFNSLDDIVAAFNHVDGPEYADFGFNDISYTTYLPPTSSLLFERYHFDALDYYFKWFGSTDPDFPITSFNYELYGFFDSGMSNTDKSNGELVDSGSSSISNYFSYKPPYNSLLDVFGALKYDKVILYLTPFSNITEGNTFYVVFNVVRGVGFELNLGPLGSVDVGSSVRDVQFGDGVLPVPQTDALLIEDDKYMPVSYIDQVPVIYAIKTTSGSYNRHIDIYHENISYAPVVYGDTEYITNNDNSKVTNNNQSYNVIINNINGTLELDPDGSGYADSIVSFLSMIVVFFQTCWTYFFQGLLFFPDWVRNLISGLIGLLATIVAALAVLKIMRGIL